MPKQQQILRKKLTIRWGQQEAYHGLRSLQSLEKSVRGVSSSDDDISVRWSPPFLGADTAAVTGSLGIHQTVAVKPSGDGVDLHLKIDSHLREFGRLS